MNGNEGYILAWIKSEKRFLLICNGSGDNLDSEDIDNGMESYVMWSTFKLAECVQDDMVCDNDDGGQLMFDHEYSRDEALTGCYDMAFDKPYDKDDVEILVDNL